MATDPMTAPDLDELARLLEEAQGILPVAWHARADNHGLWRVESANELVCEGCTRAEAVAIAAAVNALPALLATARRERRYKALLEVARAELDCPHGEGADPAFNYGHRCVMCDDNVDGNMVLRKRIDAALAEEGQNG